MSLAIAVGMATHPPGTDWRGIQLATLGHSSRSLEEVLALLEAFDVEMVADIRRFPRSRRNPDFNLESLPSSLRARGVGYEHLLELGGRRRPLPSSINAAWRNESFRGFADYLQTPELERALARLHALAASGKVALMCAEAVPWRCHRTLIADVLTARGADVQHITSATRASAHRLTPFAKVEGGRVTYPLVAATSL